MAGRTAPIGDPPDGFGAICAACGAICAACGAICVACGAGGRMGALAKDGGGTAPETVGIGAGAVCAAGRGAEAVGLGAA
mmetsp:Transcript_20524/g.58129  ORF Transcript_20524/g.58129 Transcript_20524/m.58129 type:complete len:80 (-) Transcript_20524:251-490(-)